MSAIERDALWVRLRDAGLVTGAAPAAAPESGTWYIRAMVGAAAWIAAVFLLVFVGLGLHELVRTSGAAMIAGLIACAIAATMLRMANGTFVEQLGLALSLTGQALFALGALGLLRGHGLPGAAETFTIAAFEALLVIVVPGFVHRVFCTLAAAFALCYALEAAGLGRLGLPLLTALFVGVALDDARLARFPRSWPPVGIGLALAIIAVQLAQIGVDELGLWRPRRDAPVLGRWYADGAMGAVFFGAVTWIVAKAGVDQRAPAGIAALTGAFALAIAAVWIPGLAAGLLIVLVGFATGQRPLTGLGIIALLAALSRYYYTLSTTLLVKSAALFATAALLLVLGFVLHRAAEGAGEDRDA